MKLKKECLINPDFSAGMRKLASFNGFDHKIAYRIARILDTVQKEGKKLAKYFEEHCERNEQGGTAFTVDGPKFKDPKSAAILQEEFEIKAIKPKLEELSKAQLSPSEILGIEAILDLES